MLKNTEVYIYTVSSKSIHAHYTTVHISRHSMTDVHKLQTATGCVQSTLGLTNVWQWREYLFNSEASSGNCSETLPMTILPPHRLYNLRTKHTNKMSAITIVQKSEALEDSD